MPAHLPPATAHDVAAAFEAVWHTPPPARRTMAAYNGDEFDLQPKALIPLGSRRYALVVKESRDRGAHYESGALAVAYVVRHGSSWRVLGNWPEIARAGQSGGTNLSFVLRRDLAKTPLLLVSGDYVGQGQMTDTTVVVSLDVARPVAWGRIPSAGWYDLPQSATPRYSYASSIHRTAGGLEVRYQGWRETEPDRRRHRIRQDVVARLDHGCLAAASAIDLPQTEWPSPNPDDCTAAKAR